jgi:predicted DNA-binding WGR domain protein/predicted RNA methylase
MARSISLTDTAKLIREALKEKFPDCKFSVRSKSYSGGSSIDVSWEDGPTAKEVEAIVDPFQGASFDGQQDLKTYHTSHYKGEEVSWGADYVFCHRNYSKQAYEKGLELAKQANYKYYDEAEVYLKEHRHEWKGEVSYSYSYESGNLEGHRQYWECHRKYPNELPRECLAQHSFYKADKPQVQTASPAPGEIEMEITHNEAKGGIELRFSSKPSDDILELVKSAGFSYSRRQNIWYTKATPAAIEFANLLKQEFFSPKAAAAPQTQEQEAPAQFVPIPDLSTILLKQQVEAPETPVEVVEPPKPQEGVAAHIRGDKVEIDFVNLKPKSDLNLLLAECGFAPYRSNTSGRRGIDELIVATWQASHNPGTEGFAMDLSRLPREELLSMTVSVFEVAKPAHNPGKPSGAEDVAGWRYFEYENPSENSHKFWGYKAGERELHLHWGRVGTSGQRQVKAMGGINIATAYAIEKAREKLSKGYVEVPAKKLFGEPENSPASTAHPVDWKYYKNSSGEFCGFKLDEYRRVAFYHWGQIGTTGTKSSQHFESTEEVLKFASNAKRSNIANGYQECRYEDIFGYGSVPPATPYNLPAEWVDEIQPEWLRDVFKARPDLFQEIDVNEFSDNPEMLYADGEAGVLNVRGAAFRYFHESVADAWKDNQPSSKPAPAPKTMSAGESVTVNISVDAGEAESEINQLKEQIEALKQKPASVKQGNLSRISEERAAKFRDIAASMEYTIRQKLAPRSTNTHRKARMAASVAADGWAMKKVQSALNRLADMHETDTVPDMALFNISTKKQVEWLIKQVDRFHRSDYKGYYAGIFNIHDRHWSSHDESRNILKQLKVNSMQELEKLINLFKPLIESESEQEIADRRIRELKNGLISRPPAGYFPTPDKLAEYIIKLAQIQPGHRVLEPEAGSGHIADAIHKFAGVWPDVIEIAPSLREILKFKGYDPVHDDALAAAKDPNFRCQYDRIVMNPPWGKEYGEFGDIDHILAATEMLRWDGRLVAIMCNNFTYRKEAKPTQFREWLEYLGSRRCAAIYEVEDGAFNSSERRTGVKTKIVVIDKKPSGYVVNY